VINVEYNQLDPLLRATGHDEGDANDETGYSPFPGNINQVKLLEQTHQLQSNRMLSLILASSNLCFSFLKCVIHTFKLSAARCNGKFAEFSATDENLLINFQTSPLCQKTRESGWISSKLLRYKITTIFHI
jgi:hypothetical protein